MRAQGVTYARYLTLVNQTVTSCLKEPLQTMAKDEVAAYSYVHMYFDEEDLGRKIEVPVQNYSKEEMKALSTKLGKLKSEMKNAGKK